ncbi:uncharacterized protein [Desmodus rotundus]|uniref:uncharacterized protein isoform X2 n=1 Tax=Desmodus rotundus TaxID=9430 RepID=UPI0023813902|nr:uncharacterized protein LOC123478950 isoform X2 [Desmodus rotundus]
MQIWERGDLRQVELILSWATPLPQPRLGRPPSRRTPPSPAAAAARECKAGRREAARRAALCFGTGPARRGGPVARTVRATPREQLRAAHGARLAVLRPPHLSALAASTAPAAPPEPTDPNGVSTGARAELTAPTKLGRSCFQMPEGVHKLVCGFHVWFSVCLPSLCEPSRQWPLRFSSRRCRHTGCGGALPSTSPPSPTPCLSESRG